MSKLWAFMSTFGNFYDARSPNMAMSRDPRSKFRKKLFFPNSAFNIRKSYKISNGKALCTSEVISQKPNEGFHPLPVLLGLRELRTNRICNTTRK